MEQAAKRPTKKIEAARRQLGTALYLWLAELDPFSVHVLASGGCQVASALAKKVGKPYLSFSLEVHPHLTEKDLVGMRNVLWNAMKHVNGRDGAERDDEQLLTTPLETENEARLVEGWFDLMQVTSAPVEAQTLLVWFMEKYGDPDGMAECFEPLFPGVRSLSSSAQKAILREQIAVVRKIPDLMADPKTDPRPLVLPA